MRRPSVAVVGAGMFGATTSIALARRGHAVTLIDPGPLPHPDAASTDISKVVRVDYGEDDLYTELAERALEGWRRWCTEWNEPVLHETGFLVLTAESLDEPGFEGNSWRALRRRGHALERLDEPALAARFPSFRRGRFRDGYLNPSGGWVESARVVERLLAIGRAAGVSIRDGAQFEALSTDGAGVSGVVTDQGAIAADQVVLSLGAWTPLLVPELADRISVIGQPVLLFAPAAAERFRAPALVPWAADIARTGFYGFPANANGIVKVANHGAGTRVDPRRAEQRRIPAGTEDAFREFLSDTLPELADAPLAGSRLCLYSDCFDGNFWIDRHPALPGLVVAAGGSGHAFKFAPLLGEIVADVVESRPDRLAARFAWRERSALRTEEARFDG